MKKKRGGGVVEKKLEGGFFFFWGGGGGVGVRASKIPVLFYIASIIKLNKLVSHNFSLYCRYG